MKIQYSGSKRFEKHLDFTAKILNLSDFSRPKNYSVRKNFDTLSMAIPATRTRYNNYFLIPSEMNLENMVAVLPILFSPKVSMSFDKLVIVIITIGIIFIFFYLFMRNTKSLNNVKLYDIVQLLFGQSIESEPKKMV